MDQAFLTAAADAFRRCATAATTTDERVHWTQLAARAHAEARNACAPPPITFLNPTDGVFLIAVGEEPPRRYESQLIGLSAAWIALANRDRPDLARTADFALGDARQADNALRRAIRDQAATWMDQRCRPLAAVLRCIRVAGGRLGVEARFGMPEVRTS